LLRATPILVLCAPRSIPTTDIVGGMKWGYIEEKGGGWVEGESKEKRSLEGRTICTPLHYAIGGEWQRYNGSLTWSWATKKGGVERIRWKRENLIYLNYWKFGLWYNNVKRLQSKSWQTDCVDSSNLPVAARLFRVLPRFTAMGQNFRRPTAVKATPFV
jgi:hypothetical protein